MPHGILRHGVNVHPKCASQLSGNRFRRLGGNRRDRTLRLTPGNRILPIPPPDQGKAFGNETRRIGTLQLETKRIPSTGIRFSILSMAPKIEIDDSTDAEKLDYVYRRMRAQERQEIANNVWKWVIRAIILVSLVQAYFMFSGLLKS